MTFCVKLLVQVSRPICKQDKIHAIIPTKTVSTIYVTLKNKLSSYIPVIDIFDTLS